MGQTVSSRHRLIRSILPRIKTLKNLKKRCLFYKAEVPKAFVGNWKKFDEDDDSEGKATISENGVITTDSDDTDILIAKPLKEYLVDQIR